MDRRWSRALVAGFAIVLTVCAVVTLDAEGRRTSDIVRVMGDVAVGQGEQVNGDVVAVLGNAQIDGEVDGDLTVVGGTASLGEQGVVTGDVTVVGGNLNRAAGARIDGDVHHVAFGGRRWSRGGWPGTFNDAWFWRVGGLAFTLSRVTLLALFALALMAIGRPWVERVADRAGSDPIRSGLIGVAAELLFVPVLIMLGIALVISIVGIPLLALIPLLMLVALVFLMVGFTGVAYQVGRALSARLGSGQRSASVTLLIGVFAIVATTVLARTLTLFVGGLVGWPLSTIGYLFEYAAWTFGLGAAILAIPTRPLSPPPLPV